MSAPTTARAESKLRALLAEAIGKKGTVLLFKSQEGIAATTEREAGFKETLTKEFPDVKIAQEKFAGATVADATKSAGETARGCPSLRRASSPPAISVRKECLPRCVKKNSRQGKIPRV